MPDMTPEEFRALRERLGLSQEKLARRLDVSQNTVARWESGSRKISGPAAVLLRLFVDMHEGKSAA